MHKLECPSHIQLVWLNIYTSIYGGKCLFLQSQIGSVANYFLIK